MAGKLEHCVDCDKPLSRTAIVCNGCNSTDPFGKKRLNDKIHLYFCSGVGVLALTITILWSSGLINPFDFFR